MAFQFMNAEDALSASAAECYVTLDGNRYNMMNAISVEAKMDKSKKEVSILGKTGKGNKAIGFKGTGSATFHFNNSLFRAKAIEYARTGKDFYFDMQITNEDPTSGVGRQTIILKNCNFDSMLLAKFDAGGDLLEEDMDFTFDDVEMPEEFTVMAGME